jgi:hypothetical protein
MHSMIRQFNDDLSKAVYYGRLRKFFDDKIATLSSLRQELGDGFIIQTDGSPDEVGVYLERQPNVILKYTIKIPEKHQAAVNIKVFEEDEVKIRAVFRLVCEILNTYALFDYSYDLVEGERESSLESDKRELTGYGISIPKIIVSSILEDSDMRIILYQEINKLNSSHQILKRY